MSSPWQMLAGNLAVVTLFVLGWGHARFWLRNVPGLARSALFGLAMGLGAIASMMMSAQMQPGSYIDLRLSLIAVAAFFGGPLSALIATTLALNWRYEMGGVGLTAGLTTIALMTVLGLLGRVAVARQGSKPWHGAVLGVVVGAISAAGILLLPGDTVAEAIFNHALPLGVLNTLTTALAGVVFLQARRFSADRDLLAAALSQAPDYAYVKDRHGRFSAVNDAVVGLYGRSSPAEMIGKTDFDVSPPERAQTVFEAERRIIETGVPQVALEEFVKDSKGVTRWYVTSKVPLYAPNGDAIGMAGVTRDITADKQMREDLIESRNTLSYALAEMSDGLAMFDATGRIELSNEQYRASFPYTGHLRQPGAHMRDILRAVIETGEQVTAPKSRVEGWMTHIIANLHRESEEEVNLFNGRWLQVRTRPTSKGKTLVVVTDVTRLKQTELDLQDASDKLKYLVRTDALTGLYNRRAFDDAVETEVSRSSRTGTPMSLLLIDVDRFKAYNDHYGHPAGDDCLRRVGEYLSAGLHRPADMEARYGGEEFVAILPDTDEDGAYLVAEGFRKSLAAGRIPHLASERGYVTASVGVATYTADNLHRSVREIIQAADEALYSAKAAGRDRVFGTRVSGVRRRYASE
ncbi:diguanylate cyclase [Devosia sp. 2618]|uniref:diguanylate cyclase n=1 Tax=Devosia sp. 2618 TaxID=3156454 RepID=UPI0033954C2C